MCEGETNEQAFARESGAADRARYVRLATVMSVGRKNRVTINDDSTLIQKVENEQRKGQGSTKIVGSVSERAGKIKIKKRKKLRERKSISGSRSRWRLGATLSSAREGLHLEHCPIATG